MARLRVALNRLLLVIDNHQIIKQSGYGHANGKRITALHRDSIHVHHCLTSSPPSNGNIILRDSRCEGARWFSISVSVSAKESVHQSQTQREPANQRLRKSASRLAKRGDTTLNPPAGCSVGSGPGDPDSVVS